MWMHYFTELILRYKIRSLVRWWSLRLFLLSPRIHINMKAVLNVVNMDFHEFETIDRQ